MLSSLRLVALAALAVSLAEGVTIVSPASKAITDTLGSPLDTNGTHTDADTIVSTVSEVNQKSGATGDAPPNLPPAPVSVTAVDGTLTNQTVDAVTGNTRRDLIQRSASDYEQLFDGTGTGPYDRDASIEGTAYLTYTVVDNSTYNIGQCLDFCDRVQGCVFANLYYEFNNELLDFVFSEKSNLKCAVYADIHTAAEKTNAGGQQSEQPPAGLTYIQQSTGWGAKSLVDPATPDGYDLVFGPTNGANNAPGYMGFAFLDRYDVQACADLCNTRGADGQGGGCAYFNIWRAVVNGIPTTYTCSMYYLVADKSTAVNSGQGDLLVTLSRGYARKNVLPDGGFEGYNCVGDQSFCFTSGYANWKGLSTGILDATVFHYVPYAHTGHSVGLLGSADATDALPGTLTPAAPLQTVAGKQYSIQFFLNSDFSGPDSQKNAFVELHWNNQIVDTIKPGFTHWKFFQYTVTANGNDILQFHGGKAPAWNFIDDVKVYLA
ncbi:hypothetical protein K435DRAFT_709277 [Dendrothele bispora CBS 962.96]|uniref:Fruit-body specific protein a n=1 Tax=Dendrothele bispora (strain CBS 962.96) TaxID=1314807 RepID=A0A4S8MZL5_DENBC|nr:hypothetical protein K435DRAFT_709277 [Dendrothele bispora CBS 962.96]